jgi:hypothetical protein
MLKSYGTLTYDPLMQNQKVLEPFWLILSCDQEIGRYYAWLLYKQHCVKLRRPGWKTHISVIRGEQVQNASRWGWGAQKKVPFSYEPLILTNGRHYWMRVQCEPMLTLREWYGLSRSPMPRLHLTLGNDDLT